MSKREKLRLRLRNNPVGVTRQDIETFLRQFGFILDRVSGSHHVFIRRDGNVVHRLVVPIHGQKVKPVYVRQILEKVDEIFPVVSEDEPENDDE